MAAATSLARGDYRFSEYEFKYHANKDYVRAQYCTRCKGTGNWSNKKSAVCGDGRTAAAREMERLKFPDDAVTRGHRLVVFVDAREDGPD
jgi:hypothetical protein